MIGNDIERLINDIYLGNLEGIDVRIVELLTEIMNMNVIDQVQFLNVIKVIQDEIRVRNYVYIADIFQFELLEIVK